MRCSEFPNRRERRPFPAAALLVALALTTAGCRDPVVSDNGPSVGTFVSFGDGFQSDSIIISVDEVAVLRGVTGDERLGTFFQYFLTPAFGRHNFAVELPLLEVRAETTLVGFTGYTTFVTLHYDRAMNALSWSIEYGILEAGTTPGAGSSRSE